MYLWTAIDLSDRLAALRRRAGYVSRRLRLDNKALGLPIHLSLRISFEVDDADARVVCDCMEGILRAQRPFDLRPVCVEQNGAIVWLRFEENESLRSLHERLVDELSERFGIASHPFDAAFLYHSTLIFCEDEEGAERAYKKLRRAHLPKNLRAERFVIGGSPSGKAGDYRVFRTISADGHF